MCLFTYLCISFFPFSPLFVCFVAVDFVFICYWPNFLLLLLFFFFLLFFFCHAGFISLWVGLIFCWLENDISYLGVVYKFLSVGMELAVIKELFVIWIFNKYIYISTDTCFVISSTHQCGSG